MDAKSAYEFLKPIFDKLPDHEGKALLKMLGSDQIDPGDNQKKKKYDPVMSKAAMKRKLLQHHFKSRV